MPASRTARQRFRGFAVAFGATVVAFYLGVSLWAGTPVTWSRVLGAIVAGVALGAIYAARRDRTRRHLHDERNLQLRGGRHRHVHGVRLLAAHAGLGSRRDSCPVAGGARHRARDGVLLDRFAMSRAAEQPRRAVDGDGRVDAVPHGPCGVDLESERVEIGPYLFGNRGFHVGDTVVLWHRFLTIVLGIVIAVGLRQFRSAPRIGLAMRAVVDSPTLAALHGAKPARASSLAWAMGSSLAALAGILLVPEVLMSIEGLTLLIVNARGRDDRRLQSSPSPSRAGPSSASLLLSLTFLDFSGRWSGVPRTSPCSCCSLCCSRCRRHPSPSDARRAVHCSGSRGLGGGFSVFSSSCSRWASPRHASASSLGIGSLVDCSWCSC